MMTNPSSKIVRQKKIIKILKLIRNQDHGIIEGYVLEVEDIKIVELEDGSKKKLQSFIIADESAQIKVSLWDNNVLEDLEAFDKVRLNGAFVKIDDFHSNIYLNISKTGHALRIAWPIPLDIPEIEKKCLVDFKRILKRNIPIVSDVDEKTFGIQIKNGNVIKLGLFLRGISSIPPSIINFENLEFLSLANNHLTELPSNIGILKNLKTLILQWNRLIELPPSINQLKNLQKLDLMFNKLEFLPDNIGTLPKLDVLLIHDNPLKLLPDSLPLTTLKNYKKNYLASLPKSEISGLITLEVAIGEKIPKIEYIGRKSFGYMEEEGHVCGIGLYLKRLSSFPISIYKFRYLKILNLSKNKLTDLPELSEKLPKLKKIFIGYNKWKEIPKGLNKIFIRHYEMEHVPDFEKNVLVSLEMMLNEPIPKFEHWHHNENSVGYLIENNHIIGIKITNKNLPSIPENLVDLKELCYLDLSWNKIDKIPKWLRKLKNLKELSFSFNNIKIFPNEISSLLNLEKLHLNTNFITEIPPSIENCVNLIEFDVNQNIIQNVPAEIGQLFKLKNLNFSFNKIRSIPQSIIHLESLKKCDFSINKINYLPFFDLNLKSLEVLDISFNNLEEIPDSIGNLHNLKSLNLFHNRISKIPEILFELSHLKECDFRLNPLSLTKSQIEFCVRLLPNDCLNEKYFNEITNTEENYKRFQDLDEEECNAIISLEFLLREQIPIENKITKNKFGIKIKDNHIVALNLSNARLSVIPKSIGSLKYLTRLYLFGNKLKSIPNEIGRLTSLEVLYLDNNELEYLPLTIGSLRNLTQLNINNNDLSFLPDSFQNLTALKVLRLKKNPLRFFPSVLWPLENLKTLQFSREDIDSNLHQILRSGKNAILNLCQYQHFFYEDLVIKIKENGDLDFKDKTNPNLCKYAKYLEEECMKVKTRTAKQVLNLLKQRCFIKTKGDLKLLL